MLFELHNLTEKLCYYVKMHWTQGGDWFKIILKDWIARIF